MTIVGLTGGIGSGKTTVAKSFQTLGIPVYIADIEAKKLMNHSKVIQRKLKTLFGDKAYIENELNRPYLAEIIFNDKSYLERMNAIVHPRVGRHFEKWVAKQNSAYVIKEVAILFENNSYKNCDFVITVTAPLKLRIKRLLQRDDTTEKRIKAIMDNQWPDEKKIELSDFVIQNEKLDKLEQQVLAIHYQILNTIK